MSRRALHYVLKIGKRNANIQFFRDLLGMKVLRHEEFHEMCQAQCNGPYDGKWSKTMIGYGPESDNFVLELTYNYGIDEYKLGNDLVSIRIESKHAYQTIRNRKDLVHLDKDPQTVVINSPDGYLFEIRNTDKEESIISQVSLSTANLCKSLNYWHGLLGMNIIQQENGKKFSASFRDKDALLEMIDTNGQPVRHEKAYGRIAFACAESELSEIQQKMKENQQKVLKELVSLDTPGKATVQVVILADPDQHEICFVGSKGFDELSKVDPKANDLLEEAMKADKSEEWFKKRGINKEKCQ
ncbi:glyoxalase domain containing 4 [Sarcoptes scabiei]|nr:glyoxalase domain containing 4 [Sarcoptes scabiei]